MEIKACLVTIGSFTALDSQSLNSPTYGRDSGPYGQRIVMSRNRQLVYHYCQYYGLRTGMRSWIIDKRIVHGLKENLIVIIRMVGK